MLDFLLPLHRCLFIMSFRLDPNQVLDDVVGGQGVLRGGAVRMPTVRSPNYGNPWGHEKSPVTSWRALKKSPLRRGSEI